MPMFKIKEIASSVLQDQQGIPVLQGQGITVIDTTNTFKPKENYLVTIYKISSSPTVEANTDGDNTEEHN